MDIRLRGQWAKNQGTKIRGGLQTLDGTKAQIKESIKIEGKMVSDPGGYCCMWSFLQMDFRLKHPKLPPNELANRLVKSVQGNPQVFFRKYIRGYTNDIMETLIKEVGLKNMVKITGSGGGSMKAINNRADVNDFMKKVIAKMWKLAGGK